MRKQPKKPSRLLGHIVFPRKERVVERLPDTKDELEAVIVDKFVGALSRL